MLKDELSGKVLTHAECALVYNSKTYWDVLAAIHSDQLQQAQTLMDSNAPPAVLMRRGFTYFKRIEGVKMMDGERERRGVYDLLLELNKMVATKLQGKIANLFVSRTSTSLEFAGKVRDSLVAIGSLEDAIFNTLALLMDW